MKASELREKSVAELKELLLARKEEQFNLRVQHSLGQLENSSRIGQVRKDIARIKTILSNVEREERNG